MAMVSADGSSQPFGRLTAQIGWSASNEPSELLQWLCHDDSTINIVSNIIIMIIITCVSAVSE